MLTGEPEPVGEDALDEANGRGEGGLGGALGSGGGAAAAAAAGGGGGAGAHLNVWAHPARWQ
jgi:hypothetical protein